MMNYMPAGPGQPPHMSPATPAHHQQRRQQEYHNYHVGPPQSPIHPHAYANFHPPYYTLPVQPPYQPQRWHHQVPYPPQPYMPMQQVPQPYQPRSPMVVSSQPHASGMPAMHRHHSMSQMPHAMPSPRPVSQHVQHQPHMVVPPSPVSTPKEITVNTPPPAPPAPSYSPASSVTFAAIEHRMPFYPALPWYSPGANAVDFPNHVIHRRKKLHKLHNLTESVALPLRESDDEASPNAVDELPSEVSTIAAPSDLETPATSQAPSESDFAPVATPSAPINAALSPKSSPMQQQHARKDTRSAIAVPNLPAISKAKANVQDSEKANAGSQPIRETTIESGNVVDESITTGEAPAPEEVEPKPGTKAAPKSWADLVRTRTLAATSSDATASSLRPNKPTLSKSASLAEALKQYDVEQNPLLSFLEPRGLVNTGNMCYMNSILQVLVFCSPFYSFLDQVRQRTVHSLNSETPLLDAIIMFMREFKSLATADTAGALSNQLNPEQLEQYGEPVIPEYVYDAIRKLPRFQTMRRGHQQDAEEFLGFLLEGLHDECVHVITDQRQQSSVDIDAEHDFSSKAGQSGEGWLEVGPKQKSSITRTAGTHETPSPIDKIFGGHLRSELRVAGSKDSVTLEPYKPLQLDIGAPSVHNIIDALKGLTRTEALVGDFGGNKNNTAKKQVFIDTLPPVLIIHLKRFQYDNNLSGTQKIWKKVGYPLELEIPREAFPPAKRGGFAVKGGLPKYRLISVVYHHGKSAAGGHYTVDVLRQDGREWMRIDDTLIRRIRSEDVAEGGAEEDPKVLAAALEQHKADQDLQKQRNMYEGLDSAEHEAEDERPWSEVNGHVSGNNKKWTSIVNTDGTATPTSTAGKRTPTARREGVKDNKVAYILLYERVRP